MKLSNVVLTFTTFQITLYVQIQRYSPINGLIPELIRLLTEKHGFEFDEAGSNREQNGRLHKPHYLGWKPLKNGLLTTLKKLFHTLLFIIKKLDAIIRGKNSKIHVFKLLTNTTVFTWLTWISHFSTKR